MVFVQILFNLSFGKSLYTVFQICIILLYKETLRMSEYNQIAVFVDKYN